ncbi:hypothetical protein [uncultured Shewanella sp.]|uniref:hypothetical protein n=1 Tax=uncultured Shewanella sp. TaxID=173975 RepID=UPI00262E0339|nr:hypothetical protein [uncultured Shewanella sp.]
MLIAGLTLPISAANTQPTTTQPTTTQPITTQPMTTQPTTTQPTTTQAMTTQPTTTQPTTTQSTATQATTTQADKHMLTTTFGKPTYLQTLHYRKMYDKKPFPDAKIFYYDNGVYKILSQGEDHYGLYVLSGSFTDQTYTIRFISLPSDDWGQKTAFHQLTFINNDANTAGTFIQNAIVETGMAIAQQNGTFTIEKNTIVNPIKQQWDE